jgi:transcriptional regulator with XRE-family HTH domain
MLRLVATRESPGERGRRRGDRLLRTLLDEFREARMSAGLSQEDVGRAIGLSKARISAIERGTHPGVSFVVIAQMLAAVGLELAARAFPVEGGLRDAGQGRLLRRFLPRVAPTVAWRTEVPIGGPGDLRAWDALLSVGQVKVGVDAETRLRDFQAVDRRVMLKARDSRVDRVILLVADTRHNRDVLRALRGASLANYPIAPGSALAALAEGRDPGGNAIVVL